MKPHGGSVPEDRDTGIGASEIAKVVGVSRFGGPWNLYATKLHLIGPEPPNEAMSWGVRLQKLVAEVFTETTGLKHVWKDQLVRHPERSWQFASPDALVCTSPMQILEVKTAYSEAGFGRSLSAEVPLEYLLQIQWQMNTLRMLSGYLAALIFPARHDKFRYYRLAYDPELGDFLVEQAERFWYDHVLLKVPPPLDASPEAKAWLERRYPQEKEALRDADDEELVLLRDYAEIRRRQEAVVEHRDKLEALLKERIGDAQGLRFPEGRFTWKKSRDRSETNWEELAQSLLDGMAQDEKDGWIEQHTHPRRGERRIHFTWRDDGD